jgi:hypothetical protein
VHYRRDAKKLEQNAPAQHGIKDDLSRYLRIAEKEEIIITRHDKPAGLQGANFRAGKGTRLEDLDPT